MNPIPLTTPSVNVPPSSMSDDKPEGLSLFLPDVSGLKTLPECGEITFRYERKELVLGDDTLSARVCLCAITKVKGDPKKENDKADDAVDKLFAEAQSEEKGESEE